MLHASFLTQSSKLLIQRLSEQFWSHVVQVECDAHDMVSPTDYRRLARHQGGLYFVTQGREEMLYEEFMEVRICVLNDKW
jgi:hypothetical protein